MALSAGHVVAFYYGIVGITLKVNFNEWGLVFGAMLIIELAIWDFILMPFIVIVCGNLCCKKAFAKSIFEMNAAKPEIHKLQDGI